MPFIFVGENDNNSNNSGNWWKPAVQIFGDVSTWIVVPIVLALIIGKTLDAHFGTKPWIFLGLTGIAFIISIFGIVRAVTQYMKNIESTEHPTKDLNKDSEK